MSNTHYIPRLLIRQFAEGEKVNSYDYKKNTFQTKKLRKTFSDTDLFDEELESAFAKKLEGPFGNLLNHKLFGSNSIFIDRKENMLLRKFFMINFLRAPIINGSWNEVVERTRTQEHPSVQAIEFLCRHHPEFKDKFQRDRPSDKTYLRDLKRAMEIDSLAEIADPKNDSVPVTLQAAARRAMVSAIAFWDSADCGQEFILPKLPGISRIQDKYIGAWKKAWRLLLSCGEDEKLYELCKRAGSDLPEYQPLQDERFSSNMWMSCYRSVIRELAEWLENCRNFTQAGRLLKSEDKEMENEENRERLTYEWLNLFYELASRYWNISELSMKSIFPNQEGIPCPYAGGFLVVLISLIVKEIYK